MTDNKNRNDKKQDFLESRLNLTRRSFLKSTAAGANFGFTPWHMLFIDFMALRESCIVPPTKELMVGAAPMTMPPRPTVSTMALSPMSPAASSWE